MQVVGVVKSRRTGQNQNYPVWVVLVLFAGRKGFEPSISSVTGTHVIQATPPAHVFLETSQKLSSFSPSLTYYSRNS